MHRECFEQPIEKFVLNFDLSLLVEKLLLANKQNMRCFVELQRHFDISILQLYSLNLHRGKLNSGSVIPRKVITKSIFSALNL